MRNEGGKRGTKRRKKGKRRNDWKRTQKGKSRKEGKGGGLLGRFCSTGASRAAAGTQAVLLNWRALFHVLPRGSLSQLPVSALICFDPAAPN